MKKIKDTEKNNNSEKDEIKNISIDEIKIYENVRIDYDDSKIIELAESIDQSGLINPITLLEIKDSEYKYKIISGHRRFKAYKYLKEKKEKTSFSLIPCIIKDSVSNILQHQIIENIQRENLTDYEFEKAVYELSNKYKLKNVDISSKLGISKSRVSEKLKAYKERLKSSAGRTSEELIKTIDTDTMYNISNLENDENKKIAIAKISNGNFTRDEKRAFINNLKENEKSSAGGTSEEKPPENESPEDNAEDNAEVSPAIEIDSIEELSKEMFDTIKIRTNKLNIKDKEKFKKLLIEKINKM